MSPTATPPVARMAGSHWVGDLPTTDYWNPPTCARQHARQRALAIVLAFVLAALAAQAAW